MQNYLYANDYWTPRRCTRGGMGMASCTNKWIAIFFVPGGKICFDTFIAISCWFLVDQTFKAKRFMKMWLEVLFYSLLTIIIATCLGSTFSAFEWFAACLPITGAVQGYAQTYLAFYLILPLLSIISRKMSRQQNIFTIVVMSIFVFLYRFFSSIIWSEQSVYCRLILFIYIFFLIRYMKNYSTKILDNSVLMFFVFVFGYIILYSYYVFSIIHPKWEGWKWLSVFVVDEGGILFAITGLAFFFFFKNLKLPANDMINAIASSTFAVLLIHDGHFSRGWTWKLLRTTEWFYSQYYFLYVVLCEVMIYFICTVIDYVRKNTFEKLIFNTRAINLLCKKWDSYIADDKGNL